MKRLTLSFLILSLSLNLLQTADCAQRVSTPEYVSTLTSTNEGAFKGYFDWKNIESEPFEPVMFGHTSYKEFKKQYKYFKKTTAPEGQIILSNKKPQEPYSEIRAGFKEGKLDWIEFILKKENSLEDFLSLYGTPKNINKAHSEYYNYYDYGYFNVSTDKTEKNFYSITFFEAPELDETYNRINGSIPSILELNFPLTFIPGEYLEMDFAEDYPSYFPKFNKNGTKTYTIKDNILKDYKKVELVFENGILSFISLYPNKVKLNIIVETYGMVDKVYTADNKLIYEYKNFTVVTDSKNNVINIGLFAKF